MKELGPESTDVIADNHISPTSIDSDIQLHEKKHTGQRAGSFMYLALGLGLAAYCMVLLISRDALIETIALLGTGTLALISASMWVLWVRKEPQ